MSGFAEEKDYYWGTGRPRNKKKADETDKPSHYQFAHWDYDDGKRFAVPVGGVRKDKRAEFPLISTTISNEGTETETLVWLHFDLDFKRADKQWIREGKLDWPTIAARLLVEAAIIVRYLSHVVLSSGGQGLSLALAISPLELIDSTTDVQRLAMKVQDMIIRIFTYYGMGADAGARGLKRLMPNMFRQGRVLDQADFVLASIQKYRPAVLKNLARELQNHPALRVKPKSEREDILWPNITVERPLSRLYTDLLDLVGPWGSLQMKVQEIVIRYGISKDTVYKLLANPPKWLGVEKIRGEGYRLTIRPTSAFSDRAYGLLMEIPDAAPMVVFDSIQSPETVLEGSRNRWLVSLVLQSKWAGYGKASVDKALRSIIPLVPQWQNSQSLTRGLEPILRSIYRNKSSLKGSDTSIKLPGWWLDALSPKDKTLFSEVSHKKAALAAKNMDRDAGILSNPRIEAVVLPFPSPSSHASGDVMPGVRGGPGPWVSGETQLPGIDRAGCDTVPSAFQPVAYPSPGSGAGRGASVLSQPGVDTGQPEIYPAGRAVSESAAPIAPPNAGSGAASAVAHLSGSALSGAFSKALMRSGLSAGEKARILTEVTSITDIEAKERARREWLAKLT